MTRKILTVATILSLVFILGYTASVQANNAKALVPATSTPDLVIETITWSPADPSMGETVTFTVTIKNQGSSLAGSSRVAYYIDDVYLTSSYVSPIDSGAKTTKTFTWKAQAGSHDIKAVADSDHEVTESNEANNTKTYSFSVLAPDLIIETITWSPGNPSKGDTVTFNVKIKNQGTDRASSSRVYFYVDGSSRGYQEVQAIEAGAAVTKPFTWLAQAGSHDIKAIVDKDGWITESDKDNNEKTVTFFTLAPDLTIDTITWSPENPSAGDTVTFTIIIKNQGSGKASNSRTAYYIDNNYFTSALFDPMNPDATGNKTFTWTARAGSHNIKAVADYNNEVTESDEDNNEKTVVFSTLTPDLTIDTITWSPAGPSIGETVTFDVMIKNQGNGRASSSRVYFYVDSSYKGYQEVQAIEAGATANKTFTWKAQVGSHDIKAVADHNKKVTESDENNNEKTITFTDLSLSDLIVEDITWLPASPSLGDTVTFNITVKNQGSGKSGNSHVAYYIDDTYLDSLSVDPVNPGATANKTFTWIAEFDLHDIKAVADYYDKVTESNETNNEKTVIFSALAPDLIIETITGLPASPLVGDTVTFIVTIKNQGSGRAPLSRVYFYIDDSSRGYQDVPELDAGTAVTKTFTWIAEFGLHDIKAVTDDDDKVAETDEDNNEKTIIFPIPDLVIEAITGAPASPSLGDMVTFTVTIKNQGSDRAGSSRVYFYINGSSRGYQDVSELDAGAAVTKTLTWTAQAGSYDIKAVADNNNEVSEGDETNNEKTLTFSILVPDLIIETITWSSENPSESDDVTFTVTIKNQGSSQAGNFRVAYYIDDTYLTSAPVSLIDPGATENQTFTWTAQAGSHDIKAVVDQDNSVTESQESNNERTVTLSISPSLASTPTPEPTPSIKPPETTPEKSSPFPSLGKGIWLDLLFVLIVIVLIGTLVKAMAGSRQK